MKGHDQRPWTVTTGEAARTMVMPLQPSDDVRGETSVEPGRVNSAADDVDGSPLGDAHGPGRCRRRAVWDLEGTCVSWTPPSQILRSTERWNIAERLNRDGPTSPAARASDSARRAGFRLRPLRGLPTSPAARASSRQPSPVGMVALAGRRSRPSRSSPERASEGWLAALDDFRNWLIREAA